MWVIGNGSRTSHDDPAMTWGLRSDFGSTAPLGDGKDLCEFYSFTIGEGPHVWMNHDEFFMKKPSKFSEINCMSTKLITRG